MIEAQVSNYSFTQSSGTFASIASTGTLVTGSNATTTTTNDTTGWAATIPFPFQFNGIDYTSIYVNSNGGATFGTTTSTAAVVISSSSGYAGSVGVMNRDLWGVFVTSGTTTTGSNVITNVVSFNGMEVGKILGNNSTNGIPTGTTVTAFDQAAGTITMSNAATASAASALVRYGTGKILTSTIGTAPNRVFVIEWVGYNDYGTTAAASNYLNFQLKLAETSNVVSIVYGPQYNTNTTIRTNEIGLRGATNADFNNRSGGTTTTTVAWNATTAGTSNSATVSRDNNVFPTSGQTFTWTPPSCIPPTGVSASNVTSASASLSWTASVTVPANGYEYYYSTTNTAPTATTAATGSSSTTSTPLSGLTPNTTYYVWVRSACSATDKSAWSAVSNFKTLCVATTAPYAENFDTTAVGSSSNTNAPNCWKYLEPSNWAGYGYVNTYNTSSPNGYYIYSDAASTGGGMLLSPQTSDLMNGNNRVRFSANGGGSGYTMEVGTLSDPSDASTFTAIGNPISLTTTFAQFTVNIPSGTNQFLAFRHAGGGTYRSIRLDDIILELLPSCVEPTTVAASNITPDGATLSWTAPSTVPANGYEYYYSTTNTAPTATTVATGTSSGVSTPLSGLTANTTYYVWVRSICSATDKSAWSVMSTFITACSTYVPNYTNDFSTFPGACWSRANGGTPSSGPGTGTTNYWTADGFLNNTSSGAARINLYYYDRAGWLISPTFNLSAGGYQVKFNYGITEYTGSAASAMGSDDVVNVLMSTDNGLTWTVIQTWNAGNAPDNTSNIFVYPVTSTSNQVKFALYGSDGTVEDSEDYNFYVDNFTVETIPNCVEPTSVVVSNIAANTATVAWTAPTTAPANGYEYYYSTTNTAPTATTSPSGTSTALNASLSGLAANTVYYVWVRSACSGTDKSVWSVVAMFTTACTSTNIPYSLDFTNVTTPELPSCTSAVNYGNGNTWNTYNLNGSGFTGNVLNYSYNSANAANTWFFTQGINLTAGMSYRIQYKYGNASAATYPEKLKVAYGTSASATAMTNPLADYPNVVNSTATSVFVDFVPATTGVYYFGFQAYSDADMNRLYVDDINIDLAPACSEPSAVNVSAVSTSGATVGWTAPATSPSGGYEIYYSTSNTPPTTTTTPSVTVSSNFMSTSLSQLNSGTQYYVWVRSNCGGTTSAWTSIVSFTTLLPPPANDNCSDAAAVTPGATFAQNPVTGTTVGATNANNLTATCLFSPTSVGGNVWYTVVVPASGNLTIETGAVSGSPLTDTVVSVFTDCSSTSSIACDDDGGTDAFSKVVLTGQTPGATLYVSVWRYSTATDGAFQISAYDSSLSTSEGVKATKNEIKAYPNPFADVLNISDVSNVKSISVVDISGKLVKTFDKPESTLHLRDLNSGMYLVILNMKDGSKQTIKAIKK